MILAIKITKLPLYLFVYQLVNIIYETKKFSENKSRIIWQFKLIFLNLPRDQDIFCIQI